MQLRSYVLYAGSSLWISPSKCLGLEPKWHCHFGTPRQHRRLYHVSTLMVGRLGDLWEWTVLNHQQSHLRFSIYRRVSRYPPLFGRIANYVEGGGVRGVWGGLLQLKPALCAIGRYRGVSQLYCRKSRLDGPLSLRSEGLH